MNVLLNSVTGSSNFYEVPPFCVVKHGNATGSSNLKNGNNDKDILSFLGKTLKEVWHWSLTQGD